MASEIDPLLPDNEPAPEISGNGYRHKSKYRRPDQSHIVREIENDKDVEQDSATPATGSSPLRTILGIFTVVAGLGLLVTWLSPSVPHKRREPPDVPKTPSSSLSARVDRILTENPLIGNDFPCYNPNDTVLKGKHRRPQRSCLPDPIYLPQPDL